MGLMVNCLWGLRPSCWPPPQQLPLHWDDVYAAAMPLQTTTDLRVEASSQSQSCVCYQGLVHRGQHQILTLQGQYYPAEQCSNIVPLICSCFMTSLPSRCVWVWEFVHLGLPSEISSNRTFTRKPDLTPSSPHSSLLPFQAFYLLLHTSVDPSPYPPHVLWQYQCSPL